MPIPKLKEHRKAASQWKWVGRVLVEKWVEGAKDRSSEVLKLLQGKGGGYG